MKKLLLLLFFVSIVFCRIDNGGSSSANIALNLPDHIVTKDYYPTVNLRSSLTFGDGDTRFYESDDDTLSFDSGGSYKYDFTAAAIKTSNTARWGLMMESPSDTNPDIVPAYNDQDTGIGHSGANEISLIAGGVEVVNIGTKNVTIPNDVWIKAKDNAGTGVVNMFKVNASDEIELGGALSSIGTIKFEEDSGLVSHTNMNVSATPSDGDEMSYTFRIDNNNVFKIYSEADGSGDVDSLQLKNYGGRIENLTTVGTATYDLLKDDYILNVTYAATGICTIDIKTAQTTEGRILVVKDAAGNAAANDIVLTTEGSENIDGSATYTLDADYEAVMLYSDGSNWFIY